MQQGGKKKVNREAISSIMGMGREGQNLLES